MSEWVSEQRSDFRKVVLQNLNASAFISLLAPMATELSKTFSVNVADIGFINAVFLFISGFISLLWALLADKTRRKRLLLICASIWSICSFLSFIAFNFYILLILQVIAAIGFGGVLPISFTLIVDLTVPEKRSYALGILQLCITLGAGLGLLLGGLLVDVLPWWSLFLIVSILGFINIMTLLSINEPKRGSLDELFSQDQSLSEDFSFKIQAEDLKEVFRIKSNDLLVLYTLLKSLTVGAINFYFISMMEVDHGIETSVATILMVIIFSSQIAGAPILGKITDEQYKKRKTGKADILVILLITGPLFYILGFSLIFTSSDMLLIVLFVTLILIAAFLLAADAAISQSIISDVNPPQIRSTVFSIQYIATTIGQSLGVLILGSLYGLFGNQFREGFVILGFLLMSSVLFLLPLRKMVVSDIDHLELKYRETK